MSERQNAGCMCVCVCGGGGGGGGGAGYMVVNGAWIKVPYAHVNIHQNTSCQHKPVLIMQK